MPPKEGEHGKLVLLLRPGAGRVEKISARPNGHGSVFEYLALPLGAGLYRLGTPIAKSLLALAKHSFTRAGRVANHKVEAGVIEPCQLRCVERGHDRVSDTHSLEVTDEDLRPLRHVFVREQEAPFAEPLGDLASSVFTDLKNFILEKTGLDSSDFTPADHAIVVTGIDFSDASNPMVLINDSGEPNGQGHPYPLARFVEAWENSNFYYTATDTPLPSMLAQNGNNSISFDWGSLSNGFDVMSQDFLEPFNAFKNDDFVRSI